MAGDDERTVFGQKLPPQTPRQPATPPNPVAGQGGPPQAAPPAAPAAPQAPPPAGERTIFGVKVPGAQPVPPHQPAPPPQYGAPPVYGQPPVAPPPQATPQTHPQAPPAGSEDTWLGGAVTPTQGAPVAPPAYPPQQPVYPHPQAYPPGYAPAAPPPVYPPQAPPAYPPQAAPPPPQAGYPPPPGYAPQGHPGHPAYPGYPPPGPPPAAPLGQPTGAEMQFPTAGQPQQPAPAPPVQKIAFQDALRGMGLEVGDASNPIIAAASDLLILLGRLRTGVVEMSAIPLRDHVLRAMAEFTDKCMAAGVPPEDIDTARYALAATADDIVQTVPGEDPQYWQQFSMAAELLGDRSAGIGFFARLEQVMAYPTQRKNILELMLTCLSLGFEGRYRAEPNGAVTLMRIRAEVYQRFRHHEKRPTTDLSHKWLPVLLGGRRRHAAMPLWVVASVAAGMVVALFATLSYLLSTDARAASDEIIALHRNVPPPVIEGGEDTVVYEAAPTGQLERIQGLLAPQIEAGIMDVLEEGDWILIRLGSALRFASGSPDLLEDYTELMGQIAQVLEVEPGEVLIEGHSDNVPMRGSGRFKTNEALSEARAQTVSDLLSVKLSAPERLSVAGVGPADPIDDADTAEARAKNRRVEVLLRKENRL